MGPAVELLALGAVELSLLAPEALLPLLLPYPPLVCAQDARPSASNAAALMGFSVIYGRSSFDECTLLEAGKMPRAH
jgi:hypothetical protein